MPVGKAALLYAAAPGAVFGVSLPDGAVAPCTRWSSALAPSGLFCREPSELLVTLAAAGEEGWKAGAGGALVQLA